ncbi:uncharacterized protein EAE97_011030 [Botrytis byssoidea]|uniref:Nephrocystin 3-like N-terminal domain-containing protein n=1 Tax=Botrytis byssoidea TaxID=139641 RepID=A0A9P5HYC7_9HELO|nr:uncharacterized protein EAE97_011030 [Botrytis byssoidea]KAF7922866.1 hypothetical protein EAE97_011030 [Botrytis byssoidea]
MVKAPAIFFSLSETFEGGQWKTAKSVLSIKSRPAQKIEAWLEPADYLNDFSELNRHIASRAPGTGIWHNRDDHGSLWVKGVPGAGKTVISACLVHHLRATENNPVLSIFLHYTTESNRGSRNLLLRYSVDLQVALNAIVDTKLEGFPDGQLWTIYSMVYCVVDALDEVDIVEEKDLLQRLNNLATFRLQYVKILMASRPVQQLQLRLKDASMIHISLEDDRVGRDINLLISECLRNMFERHNPDLELTLHSIIFDGSTGVFPYARLLLDSLMCNRGRDECRCDWSIATLYSIGFRKAKLDHLSLTTPSETGRTIGIVMTLSTISAFSDPKSIGFRRWLSLDWGIRFITKDSVVPSPAHMAPFSGMIDNEDDSHQRIIHEAARRDSALIVLALLKAGVNPTRSTDDNSRPDSEVCARNREAESGTTLDYMNYPCDCTFSRHERRRGVIMAMFNRCLIKSSTSHTCQHQCLDKLFIQRYYFALRCNDGSKCFFRTTNARSSAASSKDSSRKYFQSTALHVLAERWSDDNLVHAREQILNLLLKYGANLEAKDSNGRTPLWLCFTSHTTVAKLGIRCFLNAGTNVTTKDEKGHGAIYNILAQTKDVELLKLLIHHGADVSAISKDGESSLEALFAYRFTTRDTDSFDTTIQFLVKNGARCDVQHVKRVSIIERVANSKNYSIETFRIQLHYCTDKETKRRCLLLLNKDAQEDMMKFD